MKKAAFIVWAVLLAALFSCSGKDEISGEEADALGSADSLSRQGLNELLAKTVSKPYRGEEFAAGTVGGTWYSSITNDPKTFNILVAERDSQSADIIQGTQDYLVDYDPVKREWKPRIVSFEILTDEAAGTLTVIYTLREDLYWSYYNSDRKVPVTSDDVVFWYNEISGDPAFNSSAYPQQFVTLEDGTEARVEIEKIDSRRFAFRFPRIVAEPLLATNMDFGPSHIYKAAKDSGGVEGVLNLFSIDTDPKTIPSMGQWFITEYTAGQRMVFKRNPGYWNKDGAGVSIPYPGERIIRILPDENTQKLLFQQGELEAYSLRPEDLDEIINKENASYTVFNAEGGFNAMFWSFNQNPLNRDSAFYEWFTKKEFRQAMSCILNRDRLNSQVYRGLAEPKYDFFPAINPFYNAGITLKYRYGLERAEELLASAGMKRDAGGIMRDDKGRAVEFDLSISGNVTVTEDTASIIMDEASKIGIKVNIRVVDFQKLIEQLTSTYDWQTVIIALGTASFPSQGSNVWPSGGNLHLWYPLQETPATGWEERIDYLYNEGCYTIDKQKAEAIWNEYQEILLEQCPVIYLMRQRSFLALQNRWDMSNVYYDNLNIFTSENIFLKAD
jgi:peptide/nickel transport system substrate-binding protein